MRSDIIKQGPERATGTIQSDADFEKPFIAIANSYTDVVPGHVHLKKFAEVVKAAVPQGGRNAVRVQHYRRGCRTQEARAQRRTAWRKPAPKINSGWLGRYCRLVTSASKGAVLALPEEVAGQR